MHINSAAACRQLLYRFFLASFLGVFFSVPKATADSTIQPSSFFPAHSLSLIAGNQTEIVGGRQLNDWFSIQTKIGIDVNHRSEIESVELCPVEPSFCDFALSRKTRASFQSQSVLTPKDEPIRNYVNTLNAKISKAPVDAKFIVTDNKISVFSLSQNGSRIDTDKSVSLIMNTLANSNVKETDAVSLPIITLMPTVVSSDAEKFGITELIGEGHTNFAGSPKNRIHNFTRAIEQFNGIMIAPQEEFSFVKFLGDVDGEHGYLPELVIKQNKTEPEFGGGICQVSSTVFRAAIYSGLKITARRNHAYPVKYYTPYGMDATVYVPKPDLRFINNTPGNILMQATIEGSQLIFRFYGKSDGRTTQVDGPHILEHNPDGSMKTVFTQKVTDAQGNTVINDDFRSNYASPSKFPHPGQEPVFMEKPNDWSQNQWSDYKKIHPSH